jgi:hypothetical protein
MADAQSLKSGSLISTGESWFKEIVLAISALCLIGPLLFLGAMTSMAKTAEHEYFRHIEVGKTLTADLEEKMCASWILKCLEANQYLSGAFRPEDQDQRRLFVQSLIEIDGGADYFDLDKNRRVLNKSQIRSP